MPDQEHEAIERVVADEILWALKNPLRTLADSEEAVRRVWRTARAYHDGDEREFVLWADHKWTGVNEESDEIHNASLNVIPKRRRTL